MNPCHKLVQAPRIFVLPASGHLNSQQMRTLGTGIEPVVCLGDALVQDVRFYKRGSLTSALPSFDRHRAVGYHPHGNIIEHNSIHEVGDARRKFCVHSHHS